ncbi:MAG TPA: NADH-quinone oxidoreductase subunit H [Opitutaceae bacterium]|jgi:NADH-quinone oxidoreductase subunit H|nr:NADH-quinone oxidoreductase subunit H [Opitutaceae bacterium]HOD47520.1 NADH-quinone oxidoreductase subunit H [Opitutaceae bacterium]HQL22303.1 NADH-quinone oxidoreductase subunit H [Opitutaceae bacterium]
MADLFFNLPPLVQMVLKGLAVILVIFPIAGASSLAERKVAAWIQDRPGPNRTMVIWAKYIPILGPFLQRLGLFQLLADGGKLLLKEDPIPGHVNKFYYVAAPIVALIPAFSTVTFVPFGAYWDAAVNAMRPLMLVNVDIGLLAVLAVGSLGVYSVILAGWASNSKYPFLGSVRASAQLISYELSLTLSVVPVLLWINAPGQEASMSLVRVVELQSGTGFWSGTWFGMLMPVSALIYLVSMFAETNRLPFDMPEGEAELVGGFHTEYGSFKWSLFFVAEYAHMLVGSGVFVLLFLGGWNPLPWVPLASVTQWLGLQNWPVIVGLLSIAIFMVKTLFMIFFFMWIRWTIPRFRYDQVMKLGWQKLLPLAIANLLAYAIGFAVLQN